jgi:hypothetical protein
VRESDGQTNTTPVDFYPSAPYTNNSVNLIRWTRYGFGGLTEENMQDGSWTRLREATLSYTLPSSMFGNSKFVKGATFTLTGRNLLLFTDYTGVDPETNLTGSSNGVGLDYFNMPNTRSYGAALRVTF